MMNDIRKRQRVKAAGALVSGLFGGGGGGGAANLSGSMTDGGHMSDDNNYAGPPRSTSSPTPSSTTSGGRKSTAQPRPSIRIPPRGIGPVYEPNVNDVLCGRGGRINAHSGNVQFRELVQERKHDYLNEKTKKLEKAHIAAAIVRQIRDMSPAGRFLKEDEDGSWYDIGDQKAIKKVGQALREDAPDIRHEGNDDDLPGGGTSGGAATPPPPSSTAAVAHTQHHHQQQQVVVPSVTVSGRGGSKAISNMGVGGTTSPPPPNSYPAPPSRQQLHDEPHYQQQPSTEYQAIAYQDMGPRSSSYQQIVPPPSVPHQPVSRHHPQQQQRHGGGMFGGIIGGVTSAVTGGGRGRNATFSGAAAAAAQNADDEYPDDDVFAVPPTRDIAFGRQFHPADRPHAGAGSHVGGEGSMISGVGSAMSGISGLTDPMSSISGAGGSASKSGRGYPSESMRMSQLNQLRQQWADQRYVGSGNEPRPAMMPVSNTMTTGGGYGNSRGNWNDAVPPPAPRDDSAIGMGGAYANDNASIGNFSTAMQSINSGGMFSNYGRNSSSHRQGGPRTAPGAAARSFQHGGGAQSVAMSIGDSSFPSMFSAGSIMSDLSENLIALDLTSDTRLLDQL